MHAKIHSFSFYWYFFIFFGRWVLLSRLWSLSVTVSLSDSVVQVNSDAVRFLSVEWISSFCFLFRDLDVPPCDWDKCTSGECFKWSRNVQRKYFYDKQSKLNTGYASISYYMGLRVILGVSRSSYVSTQGCSPEGSVITFEWCTQYHM